MKVLDGLSALADRYDGFIVDLWGVVHDGTQPYPGVAEALAALRAAGKRICFLSNAPRRSHVVAEQLTEFGIAPALYDGIVTSGEASWELLRDRSHPGFDTLGTRAFHLGLVRDRSVVEGLGIELLATPDGAEFILNTGPDPVVGRESVTPYEPALAACAARKLPMVCVNPDREVVVGGRLVLCAGALADRYLQLGGGPVYEVGKPDPTIYGPVLRRLGVAKDRVLALGDGPHTDLAGAKAVGLDAVWVLNGLSAGLADEQLDEAAAAEGVAPIAALRGLRW